MRVKQCHKPSIWEWLIPSIYGDLGDGLVLFYPHYNHFIILQGLAHSNTHFTGVSTSDLKFVGYACHVTVTVVATKKRDGRFPGDFHPPIPFLGYAGEDKVGSY